MVVSLLRLVPEDDGAGFQGFGQVDEALVVGAAEALTEIFAGGDERARRRWTSSPASSASVTPGSCGRFLP